MYYCMCFGVHCALRIAHGIAMKERLIFSLYKLIYEITALHTAEWDKEERCLPLLPLLTLIQHSDASGDRSWSNIPYKKSLFITCILYIDVLNDCIH